MSRSDKVLIGIFLIRLLLCIIGIFSLLVESFLGNLFYDLVITLNRAFFSRSLFAFCSSILHSLLCIHSGLVLSRFLRQTTSFLDFRTERNIRSIGSFDTHYLICGYFLASKCNVTRCRVIYHRLCAIH